MLNYTSLCHISDARGWGLIESPRISKSVEIHHIAMLWWCHIHHTEIRCCLWFIMCNKASLCHKRLTDGHAEWMLAHLLHQSVILTFTEQDRCLMFGSNFLFTNLQNSKCACHIFYVFRPSKVTSSTAISSTWKVISLFSSNVTSQSRHNYSWFSVLVSCLTDFLTY